ncbi:hypothetical protein C9374_003393 [Naegleria lovaniensis]|uniref:Uncharacterized protein n=1 Tax=Naegleria lovaniensis TaxID=51637 RepID=A0AA88GSR4_NAELO|nr:uncharacterized protein C9374_003393 [Naegleria lovaniensis]KAG2385578.1 hypothetical protein C9374_003393 [Naegleria lovaniensis]
MLDSKIQPFSSHDHHYHHHHHHHTPPPPQSSEHSPLLNHHVEIIDQDYHGHNDTQYYQHVNRSNEMNSSTSHSPISFSLLLTRLLKLIHHSCLSQDYKKTFLFYFTSFLLLASFIVFDVLSTLYFKKSLNLLFQYPFLASELNYIITCVLFFIGHYIYSEIYYPMKNKKLMMIHETNSSINVVTSSSIHSNIHDSNIHETRPIHSSIHETNSNIHSSIHETSSNIHSSIHETSSIKPTETCNSPIPNHHSLYSIHYLNISICNIFETLFQIIGSNGMGKNSGTLMVLLAQMNIPLSVLCTLLIFKEKYNTLQWCGVVCILLGIFIVVILPYLVSLRESTIEGGSSSLFYACIFVVSCFFSVGQRMYEMYILKRAIKKHRSTRKNVVNSSLKRMVNENSNLKRMVNENSHIPMESHVPLNVYTLGFYERIYELILNTLIMFPLYYFFITQYESLNSFIHDMNMAFNNVLFGERQGWITVVVFNIFSYIWLQLRLLCVQYINADITFFANAFAFPFCTLVFALPFMKFIIPEQSSITAYHIVSIVVLFIGLVLYGIGERRRKRQVEKN